MIRRPGQRDPLPRDGSQPSSAGDDRLRDGRAAFPAVISTRGEPLLSPVSGTPCAYWRLRVAERINGVLQLVHEITSTEDFDLRHAAPERDVRVRVTAQTVQIEATPILHRPGSPGAVAVARQFGFLGQLSVEEITLAAGEEIAAEGVIDGAEADFAGPYRTVAREIELLGATLRQAPRPMLGPALLPFALGTVAALLGGVGVATWAAWHFDLLPRWRHGTVIPRAEIGPDRPMRRHFSQPE